MENQHGVDNSNALNYLKEDIRLLRSRSLGRHATHLHREDDERCVTTLKWLRKRLCLTRRYGGIIN